MCKTEDLWETEPQAAVVATGFDGGQERLEDS